MKGPSLQKTAALSAAIHVSFLVLFSVAIRQSARLNVPSPYIVSLVTPGEGSRHASAPSAGVSAPEDRKPETKESMHAEKEEKIDQRLINERIAAIRAKKRIEKINRLRQEILISRNALKNSRPGTARASHSTASSAGTGSGGASYGDIIKGQIYRNWSFPDSLQTQDLETIVSVRVMKDGTIPSNTVVVEKKSGNRLFDAAAVQAIAKASPVSPPPDEMEVVIRFGL